MARGRPGQVTNLTSCKTDKLQTFLAQDSVGEIFFEDEGPNFEYFSEKFFRAWRTPVYWHQISLFFFTCGKPGVTSTIFRNILVTS